MTKIEKPHDSLLNYSDFLTRLLPFIKCISRGVPSRLTYRIELKNLPSHLERQVLLFNMGCVACGKSIRPFRSRRENLRGLSTGFYFSATCPTTESKRCCRTKLASNELELIALALSALRMWGSEDLWHSSSNTLPQSKSKNSGNVVGS